LLLDIGNLLDSPERAMSHSLIPALIGHICATAKRDLLALPVRIGGLEITNPCHIAASEYEASAISEPLVDEIAAHTHKIPDDHAM